MKFLILIFFCFTLNFIYAQDLTKVELQKVSENVWVHTSYKLLNGSPFPSNGLIVKTAEGLVLFDTPWNDEQMENLIIEARKKLNLEFIYAIITHSHDDRIGGIAILKKKNIRVVSSKKTGEFAKRDGWSVPESLSNTDTILNIGKTKIETYYPGWGHTEDNIVIWISESKILYAACFVKSIDSETLGNIKDADIKKWQVSMNKVISKYSSAEYVIPGHGKTGEAKLLYHTLKLIKSGK